MSEATVGAFEAKTRLSALLDRVEKGETITITKHGRPVARLVPAPRVVLRRSGPPQRGFTPAEREAFLARRRAHLSELGNSGLSRDEIVTLVRLGRDE